MMAVSVDRELCNGCGMCEKVCPHQLIRCSTEGMQISEQGCMHCGHCQAVCAAGAITVDGLNERLDFVNFAEQYDAIAPGQSDSAELVRLMRSRRSCRNYTTEAVPLTILEDLVKAGTTAPSGTNSQSWNFTLLAQRSDVLELGRLTAAYYRQLNNMAKNPLYRFLARILAGDKLGRYYRNYYGSVNKALQEWEQHQADRLFHGATAAIVVTGRNDASCPAEDALLATQNILLLAHALGLGSCLIGFVVAAARQSLHIQRALTINADEEVYSVIGLGFPAIRYTRVAGRKAVKPRVLHLSGEVGRAA